MQQLNTEDKANIVKLLKERFQAYFALLFGSAARGELRMDSDINLAILAPESPSPNALFLVASELAEQVKREVVLVDFNVASTVIKFSHYCHEEGALWTR